MTVPQLFQWNDNLLTHVDVIDAQHREYFERVNEVLKHAAEERSAEETEKALDFVASYVVLHFDTEQDAMRFAEYPEEEAHLEQHQHFAMRLDRLRASFAKQGFRPVLATELNALLVEWFVHHIRTVDQILGRFLQERNRLA
jgi:hemerythrin